MKGFAEPSDVLSGSHPNVPLTQVRTLLLEQLERPLAKNSEVEAVPETVRAVLDANVSTDEKAASETVDR